MGIAVDFSFARPTIAELQAAEVEIVIRYLTGQGKAISVAELDEYLAAGIAVCFVFEVAVDDVAGGSAAGAAHATQAKEAVSALGIGPCPIYFAVDESIDPATAVPYFQGINTVLPASLVGDYGEGALCELLEADGLATYHWQSESTSFPGNTATLPITALQQTFNSSPIADTDRDVICKPDAGQWPRPTSTPTPPPVPSPGGSSMAVSEAVTFKAGQLDVFQVSIGALWHKWCIAGVWKNESVPLPAGVTLTGTPEVSVIGGAVYVMVEDTTAKVWCCMQTADGGTWNVAPLS
jgi:hypothetical protein